LGTDNCAFGNNTLRDNTTGTNNCAFGNRALQSNTIGVKNSSFGTYSLKNNTTGNKNSAFGYRAMVYNEAGTNNSAFGYYALKGNTTGSQNVAFGYKAGSVCIGSNNSFFGYKAGGISNGSNSTVIGSNAAASGIGANNEITLGNNAVTTLRCQVTTITALSDFRDKTDINNIEVGLSFVEKLRPVTFKWDKREWYTDGNRDGSKKDNVVQAGFIAQELKQLQEETNTTYLKLVYESNPDKLEATPGNLLVPIVKSIQELSDKLKSVENRLFILENR
jgi:hypothetical protein